MQVAVDFSWDEVGELQLEGDKLRFPDVPEAPGAYRFDLDNHFYIGETDRLCRRFQHYRTPGPSQATNVRLNAKALELLKSGRVIVISIVTEAAITVDQAESTLDLRHKSARLLVESAALTAARLAGQSLENL